MRAHESVLGRIAALGKAAALIGFGNSVRAVGYAVRRSRLDARALPYRPPDQSRVSRVPGGARGVEPVPGGAVVDFGAGDRLELRFLQSGGIFVGWNSARPQPSYALASDVEPQWRADVRLDPSEQPGGWTLTAGALTVDVDAHGVLTFRSAAVGSSGGDEQVLRRDDPPEWLGTAWVHRSRLTPDAVVLGLGGRSTGANRRPGHYRLWNTEPGGTYGKGDDPLSLTMPVSLVVDDAGCRLTFYDNSFDGMVEVDDAITMRSSDGPLRYYVFTGTPAETLEQYTALTGRPALPPRWALGYHQSRWGYGSQQAMQDLVDGFRQRALPLSAVWMDIDHLIAHSVFMVDEDRYPDLPGLAADLAADDIHLVAIVDPAVPRSRKVPVYESGLARGVFCRDARGNVARGVVWPGDTVYPDFTSARAREWWGRLYGDYLDRGVDGFWHDMNEPSAFAAFGDPTLPLSTRHDLDGRGGDHREAHNIYGLLMNRAGFEGLCELRPEHRPFLVSRSGWAGMQRYAGTWTGDIGTSWDALRISLGFTLGLGVCGVPYSGPDIGGFDTHPPTELYVRWFQLGAYLPFFRTHSRSDIPAREPWEWGPEVLAVVGAAMRERYALLPYWYTLAWQAHRTGAPYVRPLFWADPADAGLREIDDAFLLGPDLLVAPVLDEGARERTVRLPAGRWYDRRTGVAYDGPGEVTLPADLMNPQSDQTPVLVRAGAVLPVAEGGSIVLEVYPPGEGDDPGPGGLLVSDAGDGWAEPVEERFRLARRADGEWDVAYDGPAESLPYEVRGR